jgi:succinate-semialdehyde dehydrogenase/glutarate-semialdehyde dehydrogenase
MGKLIGTARAEVALSADILDYYATHAGALLNPRAIHEPPGAVLETRPLGIILCIEPWNFPYYQIARIAGPQLMVGNVLLLKPAENVPQCALAFARLFELAGAPPGAYTISLLVLIKLGA